MQTVVLVNPPGLKGRTNERTMSGGIGVSRKLKPFETVAVEVPPIDLLYLAAVAENAGAAVRIVDLVLEDLHGQAAERHCAAHFGERHAGRTWVGVRLSMPSLIEDLRFANRMKALLPDCTVFVFGPVIMVAIDHFISDAAVDYVLYGEPEAFFDRVLQAADPASVKGVIDPAQYVPLA